MRPSRNAAARTSALGVMYPFSCPNSASASNDVGTPSGALEPLLDDLSQALISVAVEGILGEGEPVLGDGLQLAQQVQGVFEEASLIARSWHRVRANEAAGAPMLYLTALSRSTPDRYALYLPSRSVIHQRPGPSLRQPAVRPGGHEAVFLRACPPEDMHYLAMRKKF